MYFTFRRCNETANTDRAMLGLRMSVPKQAVQHFYFFYYFNTPGANTEIYIYVYKANWNCSKTQLQLSVAHKAEFWYCTWHEDLFLPLINMCCIILSIVRCLHWTCRKVLFKKFGSLKPSILQLSLKERIVKDSWKMAFWSVSAPASNSVCQDSGFISVCFHNRIGEWDFLACLTRLSVLFS